MPSLARTVSMSPRRTSDQDSPKGLLVVHDESNSGGRTSNLKYVSLNAVLDAS